jgi:hypothetical protein
MPDDLKSVVPARVQQGIAYAILCATIISPRRAPPMADDHGTQ